MRIISKVIAIFTVNYVTIFGLIYEVPWLCYISLLCYNLLSRNVCNGRVAVKEKREANDNSILDDTSN